MNTQDRSKYLLEYPGFYHIKCLINDRFYAGKTIRKMRLRRTEHAARLTKGAHGNIDLQEDFDKYGMDYFEFIPVMAILTDIGNTEQDLNETEAFFVDEVAVDSYRCYNRVQGGDSGTGATSHKKKDKSLPLHISKIEIRGKMYYIGLDLKEKEKNWLELLN